MDAELFLKAVMITDWVVIVLTSATLLSAYGLRVFRFDDSLRKVRRNYR